MGKRIDILRQPFGVLVHQQVKVHFLNHLRAELVHFLELPAGIHMQHRERQLAGIERLACQMQHHGGILADRIQHHRVLKLGSHFTNDVDALGFQLLEVGQFFQHDDLTEVGGHRGPESRLAAL